MCFGDPTELLKQLIDGCTLQTDTAGRRDPGYTCAKLVFVSACLATP